jgi:hypothetical protein
MNPSDAYYDLIDYKHNLRCAEKEYHGYVITAAWSDKICHRVDMLKAAIHDYKKKIRAIEAFFNASD